MAGGQQERVDPSNPRHLGVVPASVVIPLLVAMLLASAVRSGVTGKATPVACGRSTGPPCPTTANRCDHRRMHIQVVYFDGCPSWQLVVQRLTAALQATGHTDAVVDLVQVGSAGDAAVHFAGSPTLLVNGRDLFPGTGPIRTGPITGLACRVYPGRQGLAGAPTLEALVAALSDLPASHPATTPATTG